MQLMLHWKSNVLHILSVVGILRYPTGNTRAPYCVTYSECCWYP